MLKNKLKDIPILSRREFLLKKYRELRIITYFDRLTDRYSSLTKLMDRALTLMLSVFRCDIAAFIRADTPKFEEGNFFFASRHHPSAEAAPRTAHRLLSTFIAEPGAFLMNNQPPADVTGAGLGNYLIAPLIISSELEGAILICHRERTFIDEDRHYLQVVASQLDNAVVHCRLVEDHRRTETHLKRRSRELEILYEMSLSLSCSEDFDTLARKVLGNIMDLLRIDRASVMRFNPQNDELTTAVVIGEKQKIRLVKLSSGKGIAGLALTSAKPILAPHGSDDPRFVAFDLTGIKPKRITSLACIPLLAEDKPIGVLNFAMLSAKKSLKPQDLETLNVAAHMISLAIQRQQFYQMSIQDELTGLYSFRYFKERLIEETSRSRRYKMVFSLIVFDLDKFKSINDTYGHPFGNVVLKAVSGVLHDVVRSGVDMPARFGGEELAVILPHTDAEGASVVAERIRKRVEALVLSCDGKAVRVTISGGLSAFPASADSADALLERADEALYRAKQGGRNRIERAQPETPAVSPHAPEGPPAPG